MLPESDRIRVGELLQPGGSTELRVSSPHHGFPKRRVTLMWVTGILKESTAAHSRLSASGSQGVTISRTYVAHLVWGKIPVNSRELGEQGPRIGKNRFVKVWGLGQD